MQTIIPNKDKFKKIKSKIKKDGFDNLHILSDFDRTLTYGAYKGEKTPSLISLLRNGDYLKSGYAKKAHDLFNKYHPVEVDSSKSLSFKKKKMKEWWKRHYQLLIESGLTKKDLKDIVESGHLKFRKGVADFLDFLYKENLPLVIISASGSGDAIPIFFKRVNKDYSNIFYIINRFNWDKKGKAVSYKKPIIHCMNKDETILKKFSNVYKTIKDRKNVILLGDGVGDLGMIKGFDYDNLLKIGFLNYNCDKLRNNYKKNFDLVLEGDGSFNFINNLMQGLN